MPTIRAGPRIEACAFFFGKIPQHRDAFRLPLEGEVVVFYEDFPDVSASRSATHRVAGPARTRAAARCPAKSPRSRRLT